MRAMTVGASSRDRATGRWVRVADAEPGYRRARCGSGFRYTDWRGNTVRDPRLRRRFAELGIPPAWSDVWICRSSRGHIQATGRDAAGRKQYIYHPAWRSRRDRDKFARMIVLARRLPRIRARVDRDLAHPTLSRERALAAVVRLLETTLVRIGNSAYARSNGSYGLTTIRKRHVARAGGRRFVLEFDGKGQTPWRTEVGDPRVAAVIAECLALPGRELFQYVDAEGTPRDVTAEDVNRYLRELAGAGITAKDFRTWAGTVLCARALESTAGRRALPAAVRQVASELNNTPAVCRQSYIDPRVFDAFAAGKLGSRTRARSGSQAPKRGLSRHEAKVLSLLERRKPATRRTARARRTGAAQGGGT